MMITDKDLKMMARAFQAEQRRIQTMRFVTAHLVDDVVCFENLSRLNVVSFSKAA